MATDIHKINVKLEMENAKLLKKLDQSEKKLQRFGKSAKAGLTSIEKAFAGVAATAAAVKFTAVLKSSIDAADKFTKMSQQVNVSVESLSTLQYAAGLSGSSLESMDKGLRRLSTNLFDAGRGLKESKEAFAALDIGIKDSQGNLRDVESVLLDVADKFSKTKDSTEKTALAMKLFGKSGAELIPMLNAGSDGIRAMQDEARDFGIEINSGTAKAAERFNDNMERLNQISIGFANTVTTKTLPALEDLSELFVDGAPKVDDFSKSMDGAVDWFRTFSMGGIIAKNTLDVFATGLYASVAAISEVSQGKLKEAMMVLEDANASIKQDIEDITNGLQKLYEIPAPIPKGISGKKKSEEDDLKSIVLPAGGASVAKAIEDATGPLRDWLSLQEQGIRLAEQMRTPLEILNEKTELYGLLLDRNKISQETFNRAIEAARDDYAQTVPVIEKSTQAAKDNFAQMDEFAKQAAGNMQDAFADFLFNPFDKGLDGMLRGLADTLRRMTAEILAQQALIGTFNAGASAFKGSSLGNLFGTFAANVKHGGGMAGAGVYRDVPAIAFANAPKFHEGGIAGNEIPAILQKGEEVLTVNDPRHRNNGGAKGDTHIHINATDAPSVLRSRAQIERELMTGISRAQRNA